MGATTTAARTDRRRRTRRAPRRVPVALLATAALAAAGVTGCGDDPDPDLVIIGDSITNQLRDDLDRRLGDDHRIELRATNGATAQEMAGPAGEEADDDVEQLVVNLGTNDVLQQLEPEQTLSVIEDLVGRYDAATCIHLVTVNESMLSLDDGDLEARTSRLNDGLAALARSDDRIRTIDWSGIVAAYTDAGEPDGPITTETVHPSELGQRLLAAAYEAAVDACPDDDEPDWTVPELEQ